MASFDLSGKVALVTGSTRGIGRAIAAGLAAVGAKVAVHGAGEGADFPADLADPAAVRGLIPAVEARLGPVDILVLNASTEIRQDFADITPAEIDAQVAVNLTATTLLLQSAVPAMVARGFGRVVGIGSIQEAKPNPRLLIYAALKAAQNNMLVNLARQHAGQGVTFNTLAPGAIATDRNAAVLADPAYRARVEAQIPAARIGTPEDCVGACLLLASEAGGYITGSTLFVDGGWHVS